MEPTLTITEFPNHVRARLREAVDALGGEGLELPGMADVPDNKPGDVSLPCFQLRGKLPGLDDKARNNPAAVASAVAEHIGTDAIIGACDALGPYLNITYRTETLVASVIGEIRERGSAFASAQADPVEKTLVEFSAPNSNKPQHLGHVRNNVLGEAVCRILAHFGHDVTRVNLINDRGIHICKSMLAYKLWGEGATPKSTGTKGDHLVGEYYRMFEQRFAAEYAAWRGTPEAEERYAEWLQSEDGIKAVKAVEAYEKALAAPEPEPQPGKKKKKKKKKKLRKPPEPRGLFFSQYKDTYFNAESELGRAASEMLVAWENVDPEVRALWSQLNGWVFDGFKATYDRLNVSFDHVDYESTTYTLGKDHVDDGLEREIFIKRDDGAVVYPLERMGEKGQKVVLRSNGTSVYITQDLGTALSRHDQFGFDRLMYVVANEQERHFQLLFAILAELRPELEGAFEHLSYGLVHLPHGRMKTREGTVVDADDLFDEMHALSRAEIQGKLNTEHYAGIDDAEIEHRSEVIGMAALKYFLLDVTPPSDMTFNPDESLDFQGRTGAYCLFNYARTRSLLRKAGGLPAFDPAQLARLGTPEERRVVKELAGFPRAVEWAATGRDPSKIAEYLFKLCKAFAFIFTDRQGHPIATCEDPDLRAARLHLVDALGTVLHTGLTLLGIETLEEM